MVGGEYVDALVDLQLLYAKVQSGVRLPWLLSVRLEFERKGDVGDTKLWQRRKLLGIMFEDEKRVGSGDCESVGGEGEMASGSDHGAFAAVECDGNSGAGWAFRRRTCVDRGM